MLVLYMCIRISSPIAYSFFLFALGRGACWLMVAVYAPSGLHTHPFSPLDGGLAGISIIRWISGVCAYGQVYLR